MVELRNLIMEEDSPLPTKRGALHLSGASARTSHSEVRGKSRLGLGPRVAQA